MARARGCDLHAILAGAVICWAVMDGVGVAQESAEATEDLGNSYVLARRTTGQGSVIETLLFAGQAIVTEIAVPSRRDGGATTGAATVVRAPADNANAAGQDVTHAPLSMGPGFSGTWLAAEVVDGYLVLHRIRATGPVIHEIFNEGQKVGSVTEIDSSGGAGRLLGRNSFAFESTDDRFVVHLTQADGTRIRSTTEHGRFAGQMVERVAAVAVPPRSAIAKPSSQTTLEPVQPVARAPESQLLAPPQEATGRIMVEEPARFTSVPPGVVPLPRAFPYPRLRPSVAAVPGQTASPSPLRNHSGTPAPIIAAPTARSKPAVESASARPHAVTAARPIGSAPATTASAAGPRSVAPESTRGAPSARSKSTVADIAAQPPITTTAKPTAPTSKTDTLAVRPKPTQEMANVQPSHSVAAKPTAPTSKTGLLAAKPKPAQATANARPSQSVAGKPITAGVKPSRPVPSNTSSQ
jgi:hypothetical protein